MYKEKDVIDKKYVVAGVCADTGGMGTLLMVRPSSDPKAQPLVLKYCKQSDTEAVARFRREVRLMHSFKGNGRVMQILDANLDHDPPYFVMNHYPDGDLTAIASQLRACIADQEAMFNQMIDCVSELHAKNVFHRDLKPQNILRDGNKVVVSDLGLCTEVDSNIGFTRSSKYWGTPGYLPPEFLASGGFKNADITSDVFMLGKTLYAILSGRDPTYLLAEDIPGPLFAVIERSCAQQKTNRYQSLASLRQSLTAAYDVLLHRAVGSAMAVNTLRSIMDRLKASNQYRVEEIKTFIEQLGMLDTDEKIQLCKNLPHQIIDFLAQKPLQGHLSQFLDSYGEMAERGDYGFQFAEVIAHNMKTLFDSTDVGAADKARALLIAIGSAYSQNRFAAMDTCRAMITSAEDEELAQRVHDVILDNQYSFIVAIQESACKAPAIRKALSTLHQMQK